jgi:hypothetical protein
MLIPHMQQLKAGPGLFTNTLSAELRDEDSADAIMMVINERKAQLYKQQQSVSNLNNEAEKVNLLSLSKRKSG